jgi:hypothetical protein
MEVGANKTPEVLGPPLPAARLLRGVVPHSLQKLEKKRSGVVPHPRLYVAGENLAAK